MAWEKEYDCNEQMRRWLLDANIASEEEITLLEQEAKKLVKDSKDKAWAEYQNPIKSAKRELINLLYEIEKISFNSLDISRLKDSLAEIDNPYYKDIISVARKALRYIVTDEAPAVDNLKSWLAKQQETLQDKYSSHLYSQSEQNPIYFEEIRPTYDDEQMVDGRIIIRDNFDKILENYPSVLTFGEDTGNIGDVNQGLEGLQEKYGEIRVSDVGIREATIIGQGIGLAMRGLRPIAEIQYLD